MNVQCATFPLIVFITASIAIGQQGHSASTHALASEKTSLCKLESLPSDLQDRLRVKFGSWKVQEAADLSAHARKRWEAEKPLECPGIVVGKFKNTNDPTYAILLVSRDHSVSGYKFLIFSPKADQNIYEMIMIEQSNDNAVAVDLFLHTEKISKFFSETWRKKLQVQTDVGILFACAGDEEYETDLYFWSNGSFRHEWIDY